jgi:hypothetical protein
MDVKWMTVDVTRQWAVDVKWTTVDVTRQWAVGGYG